MRKTIIKNKCKNKFQLAQKIKMSHNKIKNHNKKTCFHNSKETIHNIDDNIENILMSNKYNIGM